MKILTLKYSNCTCSEISDSDYIELDGPNHVAISINFSNEYILVVVVAGDIISCNIPRG